MGYKRDNCFYACIILLFICILTCYADDKHFRFLHTGGLHGEVFAQPIKNTPKEKISDCKTNFKSEICQGGCSRFAAVIRSLKVRDAIYPAPITIDSGGFFFGSVTTTMFGVNPSIMCATSIPYDVISLGGSDLYGGVGLTWDFLSGIQQEYPESAHPTSPSAYDRMFGSSLSSSLSASSPSSVIDQMWSSTSHSAGNSNNPLLDYVQMRPQTTTTHDGASPSPKQPSLSHAGMTPRPVFIPTDQDPYRPPAVIATNLVIDPAEPYWHTMMLPYQLFTVDDRGVDRIVVVLSIIQDYFNETIAHRPSWMALSPQYSSLNYVRTAISEIREKHNVDCIVLTMAEDREWSSMDQFLELEHVNLFLVSRKKTTESGEKTNIYGKRVLFRPINSDANSIDDIRIVIDDNNNVKNDGSNIITLSPEQADHYIDEPPVFVQLTQSFQLGYEATQPLSDLLQTVDGWEGIFSPGDEKNTGYTETSWGCRSASCPMGTLLSRAFLNSCNTALSQGGLEPNCTISLVNAGTIRASLYNTPIHLEDVFRVLPFANTLVAFDISGAYILRILAYSIKFGLSAKFIQTNLRWVYLPYTTPAPDAPMADALLHVMDVSLLGNDGTFTPLNPDTMYRVVAPSFLYEGNDGFSEVFTIDDASNQQELSDSLASSLLRYIQRSGPVWSEMREEIADCLFKTKPPFPPGSQCLTGYSNVTSSEYNACPTDLSFCQDGYIYSSNNNDYAYNNPFLTIPSSSSSMPVSSSSSSSLDLYIPFSSSSSLYRRGDINDGPLPEVRPYGDPELPSINQHTCAQCSGYGTCQRLGGSGQCECTTNLGTNNEMVRGIPSQGLYKGIDMVSGSKCNIVRPRAGITSYIHVILGILFVLVISVCSIWTFILIIYRNSPTFKASSLELSLCACIGGYIVSFAIPLLGLDPYTTSQRLLLLGSDNYDTYHIFYKMQLHIDNQLLCNLFLCLLLIGFSLIFSSLITKAKRIHDIFNAKTLNDIKYYKLWKTYILFIFIILIELICLLLSCLINPIDITAYPLSDNTICVGCGIGFNLSQYYGASMSLSHLILTLYNICVLIYAGYLAFQTRNVSTLFNESGAIAITIWNLLLTTFTYFLLTFLVQTAPLLGKILAACVLSYSIISSLTILYVGRLYAMLTDKNGNVERQIHSYEQSLHLKALLNEQTSSQTTILKQENDITSSVQFIVAQATLLNQQKQIQMKNVIASDANQLYGHYDNTSEAVLSCLPYNARQNIPSVGGGHNHHDHDNNNTDSSDNNTHEQHVNNGVSLENNLVMTWFSSLFSKPKSDPGEQPLLDHHESENDHSSVTTGLLSSSSSSHSERSSSLSPSQHHHHRQHQLVNNPTIPDELLARVQNIISLYAPNMVWGGSDEVVQARPSIPGGIIHVDETHSRPSSASASSLSNSSSLPSNPSSHTSSSDGNIRAVQSSHTNSLYTTSTPQAISTAQPSRQVHTSPDSQIQGGGRGVIPSSMSSMAVPGSSTQSAVPEGSVRKGLFYGSRLHQARKAQAAMATAHPRSLTVFNDTTSRPHTISGASSNISKSTTTSTTPHPDATAILPASPASQDEQNTHHIPPSI